MGIEDADPPSALVLQSHYSFIALAQDFQLPSQSIFMLLNYDAFGAVSDRALDDASDAAFDKAFDDDASGGAFEDCFRHRY